MKSLNLFCVVIGSVCLLQSCESAYSYSDYDEKTLTLCLNEWADDTHISTYGQPRQTLRFYVDGTGRESSGNINIEDVSSRLRAFQWKWLSGAKDTLFLEYPDKQIFYLEDVSIHYNVLSGIWEEKQVYFRAVIK